MVNRAQDSERKFLRSGQVYSYTLCWRKVVNKAQIKLKFRFFFFFLFFVFFFFCRLVLKCFIYREMVNIKDHKLSEIFLTVGLVEPIKFVLRSVIYIISVTVSDMLNSHKFSEKNCKILKTKLVRSIFIYLEFQKKKVVSQH